MPFHPACTTGPIAALSSVLQTRLTDQAISLLVMVFRGSAFCIPITIHAGPALHLYLQAPDDKIGR